MKRLPLLFWLLAWSGWLWLGFGLHRELPRDLGPAVCVLSLEDRESVVGFLHGERVIVSQIGAYFKEKPFKINLRDARTGAKINSWRIPVPRDLKFSLRHGFVVGQARQLTKDAEEFPPDFRQSLDLRTGQWTVLGAMSGGSSFHPKEPLVLCHDNGIRGLTPRVRVFHLLTGARVFEWNCRPRQGEVRDEIGGCCFSERGDEVLILRSRLDYTDWPIPKSKPRVLEQELLHCSLHGGKTNAVVFDEPCDYIEAPPAGGRILRCVDDEPYDRWDIVDHRSGKVLLTSSQVLGNSPPENYSLGHTELRLSPDGRYLVHDQELWDVDRAERMWQDGRPWQSLSYDRSAPSWFSVWEHWFPEEWAIHQDHDYTTDAVRDLKTTALKYRVWGFHPSPALMSSDGKLAVDKDGQVYQLPPKPNWRWLALCQSILALPLIMLWAVLRWRRRRRTRFASV